jgi:hypothetical protein
MIMKEWPCMTLYIRTFPTTHIYISTKPKLTFARMGGPWYQVGCKGLESSCTASSACVDGL